MSPADFLMLARELATGNRETDWRSAASRAYYAAFHSALGMAVRCGVRFGKSSAAHEKVAYCLVNCSDDELKAAGMALQSLRKARNDADYDLANSGRWSEKHAAIEVNSAAKIIAVVADQEDVETIRSEIRTYARDILGLTVVGND